MAAYYHLMRTFTALLIFALVLVANPAWAQSDRWLGKDKALHFGAGVGLAAGGYAASALVFEERKARVTSGLTVSIGASALKEWTDPGRGGTRSWRDFTWGVVGAAVGTTVAWLTDRSR